MKINVEVDLTPEELRRFMGLPDVQGIQQQWLESVTDGLQNSQEQQQEFFRNIISGTFSPWQNFFSMMPSANSTDTDQK